MRQFAHQARALGVGPEQQQAEQSGHDHDNGVDGEAGHVAFERRRRVLDHAAHHRWGQNARKRIDRAADRDNSAALRHRREFPEHRRTDHIDRSAKSGSDYKKRDLQPGTIDMRERGKNRSADDQGRRAEHAARAAGGNTTRHQQLRNPARQQHDNGTEHPGQDRNPPRVVLPLDGQAADDERREPGQAQRERPIGAETGGAAADKGSRGQKLEIGNTRLRRCHRGGGDQRSLLAQDQPRHHPHQADHAERAECIVPAIVDDQPVQRRHREDHAERRPL